MIPIILRCSIALFLVRRLKKRLKVDIVHSHQIVMIKCRSSKARMVPNLGDNIFTFTEFDVLKVLKGNNVGDKITLRLAGGRVGNIIDDIEPAMPRFIPGEETVLLLGEKNMDGYPTFIFQFRINMDVNKTKKVVITPRYRKNKGSFLQNEKVSNDLFYLKYKGRKVLSLKSLSNSKQKQEKENPFLSKYSGFSLHAGVSCKSYERKKREHICRYISRPSLSEERLSVNNQGQVIYKLKTPYQNGTTHIVLSPLDFLSRLSSLIPWPRVHLTRFHGVFAPHFKYRSLVTPKPISSRNCKETI